MRNNISLAVDEGEGTKVLTVGGSHLGHSGYWNVLIVKFVYNAHRFPGRLLSICQLLTLVLMDHTWTVFCSLGLESQWC
ncbi:unnamed protein product [Cyberlindnera jadinii]|uniref:Uncharacterized protein n=1 Tax=Cyberlindnera jadinii (strain ATCC 18201 / CBS 1600 / BCRC 20928 / JCM 3617 / NBRC 0987 / NRRL Y-1542) TaxID=983966 RepID=A0A0H5C0Y3_CYBJN|nr:unnamed protein product [Cyberlindnera jadinii]